LHGIRIGPEVGIGFGIGKEPIPIATSTAADSGEATTVNDSSEPDRIQKFLGSARVFANALDDVIERRLLRDSVGDELTVGQMQLLRMVSLREAHRIGDVAAFLEVSQAAASKTVHKMVRKGFLSRHQSETDRRSTKLSLTESSRRLLARYDAERENKLAAIFEEAPREDLHRLSGLLDALSIRMVGASSPPGRLCLRCGTYFRRDCPLRSALRQRCFHLEKPERERDPAEPVAGMPGPV